MMNNGANENAFDLNMGAGLGPAYGADHTVDFSVSAFTTINNPAATPNTTRTVSPRDIFQDPLGSAPPSAAFTNLTSPDLNSPYITDDLESSPLFRNDDVNSWYSLFPESANPTTAPTDVSIDYATMVPGLQSVPMDRNDRSGSGELSGSGSQSPLVLDRAARRRSTTTESPAGGVSRPRRRKGTLPPIAVDPTDKAAVKRARNTLAARDSRQRKFDHISRLETENSELKDRVVNLEADVEKWKAIALSLGYNDSA
jgi:general control protein GCN4